MRSVNLKNFDSTCCEEGTQRERMIRIRADVSYISRGKERNELRTQNKSKNFQPLLADNYQGLFGFGERVQAAN